MKRTSQTHPLRIDSVTLPGTDGVIGMTFCPGKVQDNALTGIWERDLKTDIQAIQEWGATAIVSLMEPQEYLELGVDGLSNMIPDGMQHFLLPMPDGGIPDDNWENRWEDDGQRIRALLILGKKVVIHCKGGLGRTGLVAARLLVEFGMRPEDAIEAVREARPGAIETKVQEDYVLRQKQVWNLPARRPDYRTDPEITSRYRGCLLGGAVGDALGAPVEFMDIREIRSKFGAGGIRDFVSAYGRPGAITDDTQMTLFTAEGVLRADVRGSGRGICHLPGMVHRAYLRWLRTQDRDAVLPKPGLNGWLITNQELFFVRAPGTTCLTSLHSADLGNPAKNNSKGCGGVMRIAPVGLYTATTRRSAGETFTWGCEIAGLTHGHPSGQLPAGVLAVIIQELVRGSKIGEALATAKRLLRECTEHKETFKALESAEVLAASSSNAETCIQELGQGWVAEEALAIALFCSMRARTFEEGVIMAVNITGDSDSTGSIAGNILGTVFGVDQIPARWLETLELKDVIIEMADDLATVDQWPISSGAGPQTPGEQAEESYLLAKYPGW